MTQEKITAASLKKAVMEFFNEAIPFNTFLGLETNGTKDLSEIRFKMKPELIGNSKHKSLHGGVTAAVLDVAGGLVALLNNIENLLDKPPDLIQKRLYGTGTIDIRIDYLMPGRGEEFLATARIIRLGSKVAVTRMQLRNEKDELLALGTASYIVG